MIFFFDQKKVFQFTTSRRGRHLFCHSPTGTGIFQFTTSRRGRRYYLRFRCPASHLSIHDLTQRSTIYPYSALCGMNPFNSRPHAEVDLFSVHSWFDSFSFQFTTSRRGRPCCPGVQSFTGDLSIHDLTQRSTSGCSSYSSAHMTFNSRPHAEVDIHLYKSTFNHIIFQFTTSRRGRHIAIIPRQQERGLSIHDLTQRSTEVEGVATLILNLSIHDLTQRSTGIERDLFHGRVLSIHDLTQRSTGGLPV